MEVYQTIAKYEWNFQNLYFLSYFNMQYLKKTQFHIEFKFTQKKYDLFGKKWKKIKFFQIFFSSSILTSCLWLQLFQISGKKFQNSVSLCLGKVLKIKVTKGELIILNHVEMADQYLQGGLRIPPPPYLLGLTLYYKGGYNVHAHVDDREWRLWGHSK